jgi:hypothetical protein
MSASRCRHRPADESGYDEKNNGAGGASGGLAGAIRKNQPIHPTASHTEIRIAPILLLAARKNWVVQGEQILFYSEDDLSRFNSYIGTIQRLAQQQEQIQKSSFAEASQNLNALKNAAEK